AAFTPLGGWLAAQARAISASPYGQFFVFVVLLGAIHGLLSFPLDAYSGYVLEHRFGLSNQSVLRWLQQKGKGLLAGAAMGLPLLVAFFALLRHSPQWWWFWFGLVLFLFSVLLTRLAPVMLFPLFYRFSPLDHPELEERLRPLLRRWGLHLGGLYKFDLSRDTRKANAALAGLGKTRRIILADTLLQNFNEDEITYVVAHEVGHHVGGHLWKGILAGTLLTFGGLYVVSQLYTRYLHAAGIGSPDQLEALPVLFLLLGLFSTLTTPLSNALSRRFEFQADAFAARQLQQTGAAVSALEKLAELNLADPQPPALVEFWFHSHPSIHRRIRAIQQQAAPSAPAGT
ncbi:MAG: M48 family peptidase, partial [Calditrichaeota bacterium]